MWDHKHFFVPSNHFARQNLRLRLWSINSEKVPGPPLFKHSTNLFQIYYKNNFMRYNVFTNWEPPYAHKHPCSRRARTQLWRLLAQINSPGPLKLRACEGTSEGSSAEVLCLNMPCVTQIRRRKNQPLRLNLKLEGILHSTCRAPFEAMRREDSAL